VIRGALALAIATVVVVAIQITLVSPVRVGGVVIMVVWLWAMVLGLSVRPVLAITLAAVAGVLFDSFCATPFAATGVVGAALAWGIGRMAREGIGDLDASAWWVPPSLMALGGAIAPAAYVIVAGVLGQMGYWRGSLVTMMVVNSVAFFVLARPVARVAQRLASASGWVRG
jgi:hypothetical protein